MKEPEDFTLKILLPSGFEEKINCKKLLSLLNNTLEEFFPNKIGNWEPIKTPFISIDEACKYWQYPFLWKRVKNIRCEGNVSMGFKNTHSTIVVWSISKNLPVPKIISFLNSACTQFEADIGYIHLCVKRESEVFDYDLWYPLSIGLVTHDLRKGIPLLPWATVFGAPYVNLLGIDTFLSAPAQTVIRLNDEQVYLQVTESMNDIREDFDSFARKRAAIMDHLSPLFQGSEHGVQVPPEIQRPICDR